MENVYIIGLGMIRFQKYPDRTVRDMAQEATILALADAGITKEDLTAAYFSNTFWGMYTNQHSIRGQCILRSMGIGRIPVTNVENACAGASTALNMAVMGIRSGAHDVALALGSEKITHENKGFALGAYASCMDLERIEDSIKLFEEMSQRLTPGAADQDGAPGEGRSIFMDAYAMGCRWHMQKFGSTQEQLALICSKNHFHGSLNPLAQYQSVMTPEEVLADKKVAYPLTRAMCAPVGDGAAAVIVCSESYLKKLKDPRPVKILASILGTGQDRDLDGEDIGERLVKIAYDKAGVGPQDISLAELHDATTYGELHQTEAMGFCPMGEGGPWAETGATRLGGKQPVNTSGGLECRGHPIGASGLAQIYELGLQLRGEAGARQVEGARLGLAENGGGNIGVEEAAMCIHILEKAN
ncbi:Acetyl-CoA acetyltransferase [Desulfatibacillum alkenivorans DSM 16219]|jgi:acetyl-CoA acetyltransferase|uniref:Acetyl-CoA acetyltransferase n=1 Tax=Desulfatibacillum alkenivorans DSM 16219 TaxID=1121393 RepID=A0A1M6YNS0_9BACT|nr:thiolase family protein [Desulfatibacillum alkenivorans]SHL19974.1 Acetyl-CoA acetyltransferase [Desulfatibacillum alkenivorans DSM 16219]